MTVSTWANAPPPYEGYRQAWDLPADLPLTPALLFDCHLRAAQTWRGVSERAVNLNLANAIGWASRDDVT